MKYASLVSLMMVLGMTAAHAEAPKITVLELFTSQGCSSCPPADALLRQLSREDSTLLPLSFHIDYWDRLGWRDPFSSKANTERQSLYAHNVGSNQIFTPQLIINGTESVVGSHESSVREAILQAKKRAVQTDVKLTPISGTSQLTLQITALETLTPHSDIWLVHYNRLASTDVAAGENSGHRLESINNVTGIEHLGTLERGSEHFTLTKPASSQESIAVIVQSSHQGGILGAAFYQDPT